MTGELIILLVAVMLTPIGIIALSWGIGKIDHRWAVEPPWVAEPLLPEIVPASPPAPKHEEAPIPPHPLAPLIKSLEAEWTQKGRPYMISGVAEVYPCLDEVAEWLATNDPRYKRLRFRG